MSGAYVRDDDEEFDDDFVEPPPHPPGLVGLARLNPRRAFERESEAGRVGLWLPVLFGAGILIYFALPAEPNATGIYVLAFLLVLATWLSRERIGYFRLLIALTAVALGVAVAKQRTDSVAAPVMGFERTLQLSGWIARIEATENGSRLLIRVHELEDHAPAAAPLLARVTTRSNEMAFKVGDGISLLARLQPPPGPVRPGGYDFARAAFYEGVGGVGFSLGAPVAAELGPPPFAIRLHMPIEHLRQAIGARIRAALPGSGGEIAVALVTGDRRGIPDEIEVSLRDSGLAHILSISGLHMVLVAGGAYWLIRALLALSQTLALTRPIKKWAAGAALGVATFYLLISGAEIATQRSYVMMAVMLVAVLLDRRAISLRNVALAAGIVLVFSPESLLTASFQMSFAAALALVAAYQRAAGWADRRPVIRLARRPSWLTRFGRLAAGTALTSLVAGLATTPFAAFHFQRIAPLSLLANVAAAPVISVIVMPAVLGVLALLPFGLEFLPLWFMDWGIKAILLISAWVAEISVTAGGVRAMPLSALLPIAFGMLWLALWSTSWRWLGLAPALLGVVIAILAPAPDITVGRDGAAAVRGADGFLRVLGRASSFEVENWLRADGDTRQPDDPSLRDGVRCDSFGCTTSGVRGEIVALVRDPLAFAEDCRRAAIVISARPAPSGCEATALVIDGEALVRYGAHALYPVEGTGEAVATEGQGRYRIETAYPVARRRYMQPVPPER